MIKFTNSRDGKMRATIKVEYRLDIEQIALALIKDYIINGELEVIKKMSKTKINDIVKRALSETSEKINSCGAFDGVDDKQLLDVVNILKSKYGVGLK